uniref:Uncharacterized protein n=1 Tax=Rhizophagus irregularis (strain DAOM 181602 / DAOM 197198 / MUCL 43194) TaxID=747089 RepID=U9U2H6_RHIID
MYRTLNRYVLALTLLFAFETYFLYQFSTLGLEYTNMNFDLVSAPLALRLRSGIASIMGSVKHSDHMSVMATSVRTEKAQEHVTIDYLQGTTETAGPF